MDSQQQEQKPVLAGNQRVQALTQERDSLDDTFFNAKKLLTEAIGKEQSGKKNGAGAVSDDKIIPVVPEVATSISCRIRIPVREYPRYNFVGKLLGPGGSTLQQLQADTGTRLAILGRNSMKDKQKEEQLRKGGDPKFAHLHMDLHVRVEAYCPAPEAYSRIGHALTEIKKFLTPELDEDGQQVQGQQMHRMGAPTGRGGMMRGRGAGRGAPPVRGAPPARGMRPLRGAVQGGRPAPSVRGAPRGAPRGRGLPPSRGRPAPRPLAAYGQQEEYYEESGYGETYVEAGYEDGSAEANTYGYGAEAGAGDSYESYGSYGGGGQQASYGGQPPASQAGTYGGYGGAGGVRQSMKAPSQYSQKPQARPHPYAQRY